MSDFQDWAAGDVAPWLPINENFDAIAGASLYAYDKDGSSGLNFGYMGGVFRDVTKTKSTVALSNNTTNYVVAALTGGAITAATSTTNWTDSATYARVAKVVTASGAISSVVDYRFDEFGLYPMLASTAGTSSVEYKALHFTSDTGSTADSDPGNGLFKWNNATEASATFLYFDNLTEDGVTITTFFANLFPGGYVHLQQSDDATKWQLWRITSIAAGSGYYKFGVALQASGGIIADNKTTYCDFKSGTKISYTYALSDESTAITAGTAKLTWRMPHAMTLTEIPRASCNTAPTGATIIIDINESGSSIISTKLSIDTTEKTSTTAATPAVLSDTSLADDAEMTADFDQVGSTIAGAGVKITLTGFAT